MRAWVHVLFWCSEEYESLRLGRVLLQSCLKVSNAMVFLPFTLDVVTNKTCFYSRNKKKQGLFTSVESVNRRITITTIIVGLRREKCSFHSQDFLSFCSLTSFPVVQTNHHFKVCHFSWCTYCLWIPVCIKDTVKMFLLLLLLFESFKSQLLWNIVRQA